MAAGNQINSANGPQGAPGLSLDDIYFTLFRHKWLILAFICLGSVGAAALRVMRPPPYMSKGEVMLLYVKDIRPGITASNQDEQVMPVDLGPAMNSETEIIKSLDVAEMVVDEMGPEKILAKLGGGNNRNAAIGVVASGVEVEVPPGTAMLNVSFKHRDPELVQPLLKVLLDKYQERHVEVREKVRERRAQYTKDLGELNADMSQIDQQLRQLKASAQVLNPTEEARELQTRISAAKNDLELAQRDLTEHKFLVNGLPTGPATAGTNRNEEIVPEEKVTAYSETAADLDANTRRERQLISDGYLEAHPFRLHVHERILVLRKQKDELEAQFPTLKQLAMTSRLNSTNSAGAALPAVDNLKELAAKVEARQITLSNLQAEAARMMDIEPKMLALERKRGEDQREHDAIVSALSSMMGGDQRDSGPVVNMSVVQKPTPPVKDYKKFYKRIGVVFGGCAGLGFVLAFAFDMVIDRTIRRSRDIEKHLRLPVFLAIPDSTWITGIRWPWKANGTKALSATGNGSVANGAEPASAALAPWKAESPLKDYTEGLRERLLTYFEVHNLNLKKPKLVAVTGCTRGAGVTTLATGLAAELSKTGDGNVLYLDMNGELGAAHPFHNGKPGPGLTDVLDPEGRTGAQVEEKLYLACLGNGNGKTEQQPRTRFNQLVPKLKASDYDYIIFDMPMVSATSATPRLAAHMDMVLMVLESEKTGQQVAARAAALMREARANVATVLNKCRPHVPARLSQDV